jgi:hypothetical protein
MIYTLSQICRELAKKLPPTGEAIHRCGATGSRLVIALEGRRCGDVGADGIASLGVSIDGLAPAALAYHAPGFLLAYDRAERRYRQPLAKLLSGILWPQKALGVPDEWFCQWVSLLGEPERVAISQFVVDRSTCLGDDACVEESYWAEIHCFWECILGDATSGDARLRSLAAVIASNAFRVAVERAISEHRQRVGIAVASMQAAWADEEPPPPSGCGPAWSPLVQSVAGKGWQEVRVLDLPRADIFLFHLSPAAFRYYLPAFLFALLDAYDDQLWHAHWDTVFALAPPAMYSESPDLAKARKEYHATLTQNQRAAIGRILPLALTSCGQGGHIPKEDDRAAYLEYWSAGQRPSQAPSPRSEDDASRDGHSG